MMLLNVKTGCRDCSMPNTRRSQSFRRSLSGLEKPRSEETRHLLENQVIPCSELLDICNQPLELEIIPYPHVTESWNVS